MNATEHPLFGASQRLPPASLAAEQALLGSILANNRAIDAALGLQPHHFADEIHARIFAELRKQIEAGRVADAIGLKAVFENAGVLEEVGGTAYLMKLLTAMVSARMVGEYAAIIRDAWVRRQVIEIGVEAVENAFGTDTAIDGQATIAGAVDRLMALGEQTAAAEAVSIADAVDAALQAAVDTHRGVGPGGLMTGIASVDDLWGGLWPACLDCLGGRSEHGKTAMGMQIATHVARGLLAEHRQAGTGHLLEHVEVYSLEMPRTHLALRMLATETGIPAREIRAGNIGGDRAVALVSARAALHALPLLIRDKPSMSITDILMAARSSRRRQHTRLIVIDHLHRIGPADTRYRMPRNEQVQAITEALKSLSTNLGIPILLLAQLSRQGERREDHRPLVSDIEYAGERDFDNISLLWRPELYMGENPPPLPDRLEEAKRTDANAKWWVRRDAMRGKAEFVLAKARMGAVGATWLDFDGPRTRFAATVDTTDPQLGMF
jgi:replicative DNA helicase